MNQITFGNDSPASQNDSRNVVARNARQSVKISGTMAACTESSRFAAESWEALLIPCSPKQWPVDTWQWMEAAGVAGFFLAKHWLKPWFDLAVARGSEIRLFVARDGTQPMGCALIAVGPEPRGLHLIQRLYIHETGHDQLDDITIEHNGVLSLPGREHEVVRTLLSDLLALNVPWDSITINGTSRPELFREGAREFGLRVRVNRDRPNYLVDLAKVRASNKGYIACLQKSEQKRLSRPWKKLESDQGAISLVVAANETERLAFLEELFSLHQRDWTSRGNRGAFESEVIREFHRRVVASEDAVRMVRICAGTETVALLYLGHSRGRLYFYQAGVDYTRYARYSPGFIAHWAAIDHFARGGYTAYEFLAGDQSYKARMGTSCERMYDLEIQRRNWRNLVANARRSIVSIMRTVNRRPRETQN